MRVRIVSLFAMMDASRMGFTWEGYVSVPVLSDPSNDDLRKCEVIFRLFNRVNESDGEWLDEIGYFFPSVSVGDIIGFDKGDGTMRLYRVLPTGFEGVVAGVG